MGSIIPPDNSSLIKFMNVKNFGIGIHGKKFSGKSEVASFLQKEIYSWILQQNLASERPYVDLLAFASAVKRISRELMPTEELQDELSDVSSKNKELLLTSLSHSPRDIWKIVGEMGRQIHPDLWVWKLESRMQETLRISLSPIIFLIDDVRRVNEYEFLKKKNFLLIRVLGKENKTDSHPTETDLDQFSDECFDFVIHNEDKNPEILQSQIKILFTTFLLPRLKDLI